MNNYPNNQGEFPNIVPLMALPNGQYIYWKRPPSHEADYDHPQPATRKAHGWGVKQIALALLALAAFGRRL